MIHTQSITGKYRSIKNISGMMLLVIYFGFSWIRWDRGAGNPSQALLLDLVHRKAYIFGIQIWPQELYFLTGILALGAFGLFFVTSLYGRIWCGYTCPHTVFTDIFVKIEHIFQGDRNARMKLDDSAWDMHKVTKKGLTYLCWLFISFFFAFGWVCYFYDAPTLVQDMVSGSIGGGGKAWLIGLTCTTYLFAGVLRQKVCLYMCPYGRFQSAMLENTTSIVMYHDYRGEPRGKHHTVEGGDCVDCGKCVFVCPMGIDIRNGLQLACIGCGLCVDACNSVMEKLGKPLGLISYDSAVSAKMKQDDPNYAHKTRFLQPKTIIFATIFIVVSIILGAALIRKTDLQFSVLHDRASLYTLLPDGQVRNSYTLKLFNKTLSQRKLKLKIQGMDAYSIKRQGFEQSYQAEQEFVLHSGQELEEIVFVRAAQDVLQQGQKEITFIIEDADSKEVASACSMFILGQN